MIRLYEFILVTIKFFLLKKKKLNNITKNEIFEYDRIGVFYYNNDSVHNIFKI